VPVKSCPDSASRSLGEVRDASESLLEGGPAQGL
jgi:hypothetical protein